MVGCRSRLNQSFYGFLFECFGKTLFEQILTLRKLPGIRSLQKIVQETRLDYRFSNICCRISWRGT